MSEEETSSGSVGVTYFPVRLQTSIFGASELNFRVRDGNGWTLTAINTNYGVYAPSKPNKVTAYASQAPAFFT